MEGGFDSPALTVALALVAGVIAQILAQRILLPGIVVLLGFGVLLGHDFLGVIITDNVGPGLPILVGFAVSIILFEGGMALNISRLRRSSRAVRQLITVGSLVTVMGGTLIGLWVMDFGLRSAVLFGTLVIVTGPTVITPLLRRFNVEHEVATVLEAEGVLIDAIGAIVAVVALEIALSPSGRSVLSGLITVVAGLGGGAALGAIGGYMLVFALQPRNLIPEHLANVFTLAFVLALFQFSNALIHESGIAAVTVAGMIVGWKQIPLYRDLHSFKEQLTALVIGMLFVLLAADVRFADLEGLGTRGLWAAGLLLLVVRPLNVIAGTWGTTLNWRQKFFLSWMGPRGIVAAAVASLFAVRLSETGLPGGAELRALVFLVIAISVLFSGLTGGLVAKALGLARVTDNGWLILGAHELGRTLAKAYAEHGEPVVLIESDPTRSRQAEQEGLRVVFGNPLEPRTLLRAEIGNKTGILALSDSEEYNLLFAEKVKQQSKLKGLFVSLSSDHHGVTQDMVSTAGAEVLFGAAHGVEVWSARIRRQQTTLLTLKYLGARPLDEGAGPSLHAISGALPLGRIRAQRVSPIGKGAQFKAGDQVLVLAKSDDMESIVRSLRDLGFAQKSDEGETSPDAKKAPARRRSSSHGTA